jgi:ribose 5-phosphate isomerase A
VAGAARRFVVIVDEEKLVRRLGATSPLPVEVVPFAWQTHLSFFRTLGAEPVPREAPGGELFRTDNGNYVVDLRFPGAMDDPQEVEDSLRARPGVVETGLFLGMAHRVLVGGAEGVRTLDRRGWPA